uniref:EamA domain-containing protein n=1 Tax=Arion vulgaris TaxID=1028688 RepID=A0A0B6Y8D3_9EUPU
MGIQGFACAVQAGVCAALATVCGKLALTSTVTSQIVEDICLYANNTFGFALPVLIKDELTLGSQLVAVAGIIFFNALMWLLFTKSMHMCTSTLEATACTTSSNFFFTAVFGKVLFREQLGILWCIGSLLMVLGLAVLHRSSSVEKSLSQSQNEQIQTKKTS